MIIIPGISTDSGKDTLARCRCSHDWREDRYEELEMQIKGWFKCPKCGYYPWTIKGMDDERLRQPSGTK